MQLPSSRLFKTMAASAKLYSDQPGRSNKEKVPSLSQNNPLFPECTVFAEGNLASPQRKSYAEVAKSNTYSEEFNQIQETCNHEFSR